MAISTAQTLTHSSSASSKKEEPVSAVAETQRESGMTRDELIKALEMNKDLCVRGPLSDRGILHAFAKYQEINRAYTCLQNMKSWPGKKPLRLNIIELCMSKSQFYDDFHPLFTKTKQYPDVMEWLMQTEGSLEGRELFGEDKAFYTRPDMERLLEKKWKKEKGKGKEKTKAESSKKSHKKQ